MRRVPGLLGTPLLLLGSVLGAGPLAAPAVPLFSIDAPRKMVTGSVLVQAQAADPRVALVKWCVGDWARTTPPPFHFLLDVGPVPSERSVRAIALDKERHPLYERAVTLNPGERGLEVEFLTPVAGQQVAGPTAITLQACIPADDTLESLEVEAGDARFAVAPLAGQPRLYGTVTTLPNEPLPLVAHLATKRGRRAESTVVLNVPGAMATTGAHVIEQMAAVYKGKEALTNLTAKDFTVKDDSGDCEVRNVSLVQDTPVSLGFAVDTSLSLRHNEALLAKTADRFLSQCFRPKDSGFVVAFGPVISKLADWTSDAGVLRKQLEALPEPSVAGTQLFETIVKSLYQFQGSQGSRALILITDGYDFDGDVSEQDALAYARQSGVKIFALALSTRTGDIVWKKEAGKTVSDVKYEVQPPNLPTLTRFAEATGGRVIEVKKAEDLAPAFDRIEKDLRTQYLVSYSTKAHQRGSFHPVEIRSRHGHVVTAAGFYY